MDFIGLLWTTFWCPGPESNRHAAFAARDFKSLVSTSFTTRASWSIGGGGRNRTGVHGFAGRCMTTLPPRRGPAQKLKWENEAWGPDAAYAAPGPAGASLSQNLEREGVSNSRPQPWQGCALPTELFPHKTAHYYSLRASTVKTGSYPTCATVMPEPW